MKFHATIWWSKEVQLDRKRRGKEKITKWDRKVTKLKNQFIPIDYELEFLKILQNLRKKEKFVEYTKELYKMIIRVGHSEARNDNVVWYIHGMRTNIQEELSLVKVTSIAEAYQFALKVEEILNKNFEQRQRSARGRFQRSRSQSRERRPYAKHKKD